MGKGMTISQIKRFQRLRTERRELLLGFAAASEATEKAEIRRRLTIVSRTLRVISGSNRFI